MAVEGPSHLRSLSSTSSLLPQGLLAGLCSHAALRVSAGKVPGGTAFLSFFFPPFFCFKDKIQKSLLHTGCKVHLQMCLQIGAEQFEYLCSWKSACKIVPQRPLNSAKLLSFEGFMVGSNLGPWHLVAKALIPKDTYNGNGRSG